MQSHFYTHIITLDDVHQHLDVLDMSDEERKHIIELFESNMHHAVVNALLSQMKDEAAKQRLVEHLTAHAHEALWELVREHVDNPENIIIDAVEALKRELIDDIRLLHSQPPGVEQVTS